VIAIDKDCVSTSERAAILATLLKIFIECFLCADWKHENEQHACQFHALLKIFVCVTKHFQMAQQTRCQKIASFSIIRCC